MRTLRCFLLAAGLFGGLLSMGGCTILGITTAQMLAEQNQVKRSVDGDELRGMQRGASLRVDLFRGGFYVGDLMGLHVQADSLYAQRYESFRAGYGSWMPAIREGVVVRSETDVPGEFRAFDMDGIRLEGRPAGIGLRRVFSVDAADESMRGVGGDELLRLISSGRIPYQTAVQMQVRGQQVDLFANEISAVYRQEPAHWVWFPVAVGIVMDAALIYYASTGTWGN